jgi:uncharacterized protein (TIGR03435 family)
MKPTNGLLVGTGGVAVIAALVGIGFTGAPVQAQTAASKMSFEAASVGQSKPGTPGGTGVENNRFAANSTLAGYIVYAWDLMPSREQYDSMFARVPKWVSTDSFEIQAVAEGNPTKDQMLLMVRSLLADRFRLQVHTVSAEAAVIALILDKPGTTGPKLRPHSEGQPCDVHSASPTHAVGVFPPVCESVVAVDTPHGAIMLAARNTTMKQIATFVSSLGQLDRPVVDKTGLSGRFDFTLEYTRERRGARPPQDVQPDDFQVTTLQEALHDQLGLKLKATQAPLDTLIVDQAERPSEN